jgi:hypothetical protein
VNTRVFLGNGTPGALQVQLASVLFAALLSVNTIAGNVEAGTRAGVPTKGRLLNSPVKPS